MPEVRIYPSNLTQTYKGGNLVPIHFLREKPWGRGCKGGRGKGGVKIAWEEALVKINLRKNRRHAAGVSPIHRCALCKFHVTVTSSLRSIKSESGIRGDHYSHFVRRR